MHHNRQLLYRSFFIIYPNNKQKISTTDNDDDDAQHTKKVIETFTVCDVDAAPRDAAEVKSKVADNNNNISHVNDQNGIFLFIYQKTRNITRERRQRFKLQ